MNSFAQARIERAKRTLVGRIVCRLVGEQTGAVLMEYVVLGVLLVAAVVGAVVMFGDDIKGAFKVMGRAIFSPGKAQEQHETEVTALEGREGYADEVNANLTDRGKNGGGEEEEGDGL